MSTISAQYLLNWDTWQQKSSTEFSWWCVKVKINKIIVISRSVKATTGSKEIDFEAIKFEVEIWYKDILPSLWRFYFDFGVGMIRTTQGNLSLSEKKSKNFFIRKRIIYCLIEKFSVFCFKRLRLAWNCSNLSYSYS